MTKASTKRVAKRTQRAAKPAAGRGNGAPAGARKPVALKAADKGRLQKAQEEIIDLLAQKGNIDIDIESAQERSKQLTAAVVQKRKDFRDVMRSVVIAHGLEPEQKDGQWNIDIDSDVITFVPAQQQPMPVPTAPPAAPAQTDDDAAEA